VLHSDEEPGCPTSSTRGTNNASSTNSNPKHGLVNLVDKKIVVLDLKTGSVEIK
jgi:hypothetical protein